MTTIVSVAHSDNIRNRVEFLMEAVLMADFNHRNVMWLIAIIVDDDMNPHVLLPLMDNGDLRSFIAKPTNVCTKWVWFHFQSHTSALYCR